VDELKGADAPTSDTLRASRHFGLKAPLRFPSARGTRQEFLEPHQQFHSFVL